MKVLFFQNPPKNWEELLNKAKEEENFKGEIDFYFNNEMDKVINDVEVIIGGVSDGDIIKKAKNLKLIQSPYAGVDPIPFDVIREKGILVSNAHENALSVAEHGFALMLALSKSLIVHDRELRKSVWHGWLANEPNFEIYGKTLGIIGLGSIGREMAKRAKAFGMKVVGTKKDINKDIDKLKDYVDEIYPMEKIDEVIKKSLFIFLSVPLTKETENLISEKELSLMKDKYLINISRGRVVNEEALYNALKNGILKGAAIDVWYVYPKSGEKSYPSKYPFHELDNIIMTPHSGGFTVESLQRNWLFTFKNIIKFAKGEKIENIVNPEKQY
ncbi:MAG TPA: 2-hydroxyacid dehydrogenase [Caldisericia bacterium]|nr:2-hydroxyacid dehydrogenase [Caldisericia bacterium]